MFTPVSVVGDPVGNFLSVRVFVESETNRVTQVSRRRTLFVRMTSDSLDFNPRSGSGSGLLSCWRIPFRHLGDVAVEKHACHFSFYQTVLTQHNERLLNPPAKQDLVFPCSAAFELTVFNHLRGFKEILRVILRPGPVCIGLFLRLGHKLK